MQFKACETLGNAWKKADNAAAKSRMKGYPNDAIAK
jgi:hypothetical protein